MFEILLVFILLPKESICATLQTMTATLPWLPDLDLLCDFSWLVKIIMGQPREILASHMSYATVERRGGFPIFLPYITDPVAIF